MNIWFTSDTHYFHTNIAGEKVSKWKKGYRNFNSVQEMNEMLIKNINDCVKEDDILYHLGDWSFGGPHNIFYFRKSLICKRINLILGNHDKHIKNQDIKFIESSFNPYDLFESVSNTYSGYIGKNYFHLSHYSHRVWPASHKGSIHLFGHSHGSLPGYGKSMDVGIDCHPEFKPFHINDILKKMSSIEIEKIDHHGENA